MGDYDDDLIHLDLPIGAIVREKWQIMKTLGRGGCGVVYEAKETTDKKERYALKIEPLQKSKDDEILKMEVHVLKRLQKSEHVCKLMGYGRTDTYSFVVMTMLGGNISDLRRMTPNARFSASTGLRLGRQALAGIRDVHKAGFVHRDVKPANFAMGKWRKDCRVLYILDFGLSRGYWEPGVTPKKVRQPRVNVAFRGTVRYCSLNVHLRKEQGRQDDVISWLYMLVEMVQGQLPWRRSDKPETFKLKVNCKAADRFLFGKFCPDELKLIHRMLHKYAYEDNPDYRRIDDWCKDALTRATKNIHEPYDWEEGGAHHSIFLKYSKKDEQPVSPKPETDEALGIAPSKSKQSGLDTLETKTAND